MRRRGGGRNPSPYIFFVHSAYFNRTWSPEHIPVLSRSPEGGVPFHVGLPGRRLLLLLIELREEDVVVIPRRGASGISDTYLPIKPRDKSRYVEFVFCRKIKRVTIESRLYQKTKSPDIYYYSSRVAGRYDRGRAPGGSYRHKGGAPPRWSTTTVWVPGRPGRRVVKYEGHAYTRLSPMGYPVDRVPNDTPARDVASRPLGVPSRLPYPVDEIIRRSRQ